MLSVDVSNGLQEELESLALKSRARAIGVALHDLETGLRFSLRGDRWFHAASTIKVAVLLAVFRAADEGRYRLDDSLHLRNRFFSVADGSHFRLSQDRDATPELYKAIGRTRTPWRSRGSQVPSGRPGRAQRRAARNRSRD